MPQQPDAQDRTALPLHDDGSVVRAAIVDDDDPGHEIRNAAEHVGDLGRGTVGWNHHGDLRFRYG